jgi:hypothetical protein
LTSKRWTTAGRSGHQAFGGTAGRRTYSPLTSGGEDGCSEVRVSPPGCREPSGLLATRRWSRGRASPSGRAGSRRCQVRASPFSPAVPPACHKERSVAVCSGKARSLQGGRCAGRCPLTWTTCGHRCANMRFRRSLATVDRQVMCASLLHVFEAVTLKGSPGQNTSVRVSGGLPPCAVAFAQVAANRQGPS